MARALSIALAAVLGGCTSNTPASSAAADGGDPGSGAGRGSKFEVPEVANEALLDPFSATETAPDDYKVKLETTKGEVILAVHREWAPRGADRFYNLVKLGFFEKIAFFRVLPGFMVQFGLHGNPKVASAWSTAPLKDDPLVKSNERGTIVFANRGPNTRTTQVFINYNAHASLDRQGFTPFGEVVEGMDVVDKLYSGYGEGAPDGNGPDQRKLEREGNPYLQERFPELDWLERASLVE